MTQDNPILAANLSSLGRVEPALAERIAQAAPAALTWQASRQGPLWASMDCDGRTLTLASRYDPMAEAATLIAEVDTTRHAGVVSLGLGLGYHVSLLAEKLDKRSLLVVFEPDLGVLRAVLERIDHAAWLGRKNILLVDDQVDRAALTGCIEPFAGMLTQGTILITHPAARQRYPQAINDFGKTIADILAYCRTTVATAMVNASRTISNLTMNLAHYAAGPGTDDLFNAACDLPAVCVSAGPSLAKNIDLLTDPAVRRKVIVITAQTTLKPLLARGIRPDFVTALDYSEISARFYEDLPRLDDVTLVAEPLAHPTILDRFPGPIRTSNNDFLSRVLRGNADRTVPIPSGATVAHLSFYLAQHLGCDPIILVGQDLGFSNGLYYCPGTAIHDVWAPELGEFNTLEMMEWQRVVRHRNNLEKHTDVHGQPIYSDEQMLAYLKQFERDFAKAPQQIIDATEGGMPKAHTRAMTLTQALATFALRDVPALPKARAGLDQSRLAQAVRELDQRVRAVKELRDISGKTLPLLKKLARVQQDQVRFNQLHKQLEPLQRRVDELKDVFELIEQLNTVGVFNRIRADRAIDQAGLSPLEEQARRLARDIENVDWLIQVCNEALDIFRRAAKRLREHETTLADAEDLSRASATQAA